MIDLFVKIYRKKLPKAKSLDFPHREMNIGL